MEHEHVDEPANHAAMRVRRFVACVAYDGTAFHGFAENAGVETVAGSLVAALTQVLGQRVELEVAGRTDRGVHAAAQVVTFGAVTAMEADRIRRAVNSKVTPSVVVWHLAEVAAELHARFSARWRTYHYTINTARDSDPFSATTAWWVGAPLALAPMRLAADTLIGEHDFSAFCKRPKVPDGQPPVSLVRRVRSARLLDQSDRDRLVLELSATAFCHNMVRSIVGSLVDVGRGRRTAADVFALLQSRSRAGASTVAPPHGLSLVEVGYDTFVVSARSGTRRVVPVSEPGRELSEGQPSL